MRGIFIMVQENVGDTNDASPHPLPQQGALLRRAHELLEHAGQPLVEELLIKHLFGVVGKAGKNAVWKTLLRQTLGSSALFERVDEHEWALAVWRVTLQHLDEVEFVVLDTETT